MKKSAAMISALLFANTAYAQNNAPPQGASDARRPTDTAMQTPPSAQPAPKLPEDDAAPNQDTAQPATTATLIPPAEPMARPGPAATPAPALVQTKPAEVTSGQRPAAVGPMKIELPEATIKFGFLLQPQYEALGNAALSSMSNNIYVRRTRIIVGATLFKNFEFFFETDYPNLFRAVNNTAGEANTKGTPGMNVQDAFATVKAVGNALKVDVGYMLPPLAHNALQSAASLYSWDYFTNSFRHSNAFVSSADPIGRDTGLQLRGLILNDIFEYRVGLFQGKRDNVSTDQVAAHNMFRAAGRLQINLLDPETGFFYGGTYLGTKRVLSFGVSYDFQDGYHHSSGDGFLDIPAGPGVLTAQADVSHWNGGTWVNLPRQTAVMGEAGYLINAIHLSPIGRYERRWVDNQTAAVPDETRIGGGLAFWPYGHNINIKAFYTRVMPSPSVHDYNQVNVQAQFFIF